MARYYSEILVAEIFPELLKRHIPCQEKTRQGEEECEYLRNNFDTTTDQYFHDK